MRLKISAVSVVVLFLLCGIVPCIFAQEITVTGSWSLTIDTADLQGGPGTDLNDTYESAANQIVVDIKGKKTRNWRVDVSRVDANWDSDFHLWVQRTADGTGPGTISGGTTYQEVTLVDQEFFRGGKNRQNVPVQLQLNGVSVNVVWDTYTTTVYYTVTEI